MDELNKDIVTEEVQESPEIAEKIQQDVSSGAELPQRPQQQNFRALREKAERAERERDELLRKFEEMQAAQAEPEENLFNPDDLIEGKHLNKMASEIRNLKKEIKSYQSNASQMNAEARIKAEFPDYAKIVTEENVIALREKEPAIASMLASAQDIYTKAASTYRFIKSLGISSSEMDIADKELAQRNAAKPKPMAGLNPQQGNNPMSKANAFANGLTPELKAQLLKEMNAAKKGY